jgi:hypothetical protein
LRKGDRRPDGAFRVADRLSQFTRYSTSNTRAAKVHLRWHITPDLMAYDTRNGLELQLSAKVTEGFTLQGSGFWNSSRDLLPVPDRQYPRYRVSQA